MLVSVELRWFVPYGSRVDTFFLGIEMAEAFASVDEVSLCNRFLNLILLHVLIVLWLVNRVQLSHRYVVCRHFYFTD